jgi:hypothetical protein
MTWLNSVSEDHFDADPDLDPTLYEKKIKKTHKIFEKKTFHLDADPDPSFQIEAENL